MTHARYATVAAGATGNGRETPWNQLVELENWNWQDWTSTHARPQLRGGGGYPVRCARQAATVPNLRLEIEESCLKNLSNSVQNSRKNW